MLAVQKSSAMVSKYTVVLMVMLVPIFGAKILFIPLNVNSHVHCFSRLAADLSQLGHVTRVLAPSNARVPHFIREVESGGNFSYTTYPVDGEEPYPNSRHLSAASLKFATSHSIWEKFSAWSDIVKDWTARCESDCTRLTNNDYVMQQVRDEGYQFAVMDKLIVQCHYAIPYSLGIPYATLSVPRTAWIYRVARFPSFAPSLKFAFTDRMNFVERLTTFVFDQLILLQLQNEKTIDRLAPDRPSLNNIQLMQQVQSEQIFLQILAIVMVQIVVFILCLVRASLRSK